MEDLAAFDRRPDRGCCRHVDQRGHGWRYFNSERDHWNGEAASSQCSHWGLIRWKWHNHNDCRWGKFRDYDHCGWRLHDDHSRGGIHHDVNDFVDFLRCRSGTCPRPIGIAAATRKLDQHRVHNHHSGLEYWLGIQMHPCPSLRLIVPGVRNTGGIGSFWNAGDQRDRSVGSVSHGAIEPRVSDVGSAGPGDLHLDRQGHRLIAFVGPFVDDEWTRLMSHPARSFRRRSAEPR